MALEGLTNGAVAHVEPEAVPAFHVHRLMRDNPLSYALWPEFERRMRRFIAKIDPMFDAERVNALVNECFQRWATTPQYAGYALIIEGDSPLNQKVVGHFLSWIQMSYMQPFCSLYQVDCDDQRITRQAFYRGLELLHEFIASANAEIRKTSATARLVDYVEHWTMHDPDLWMRFLPELKQSKVFHVMRFKV